MSQASTTTSASLPRPTLNSCPGELDAVAASDTYNYAGRKNNITCSAPYAASESDRAIVDEILSGCCESRAVVVRHSSGECNHVCNASNPLYTPEMADSANYYFAVRNCVDFHPDNKNNSHKIQCLPRIKAPDGKSASNSLISLGSSAGVVALGLALFVAINGMNSDLQDIL